MLIRKKEWTKASSFFPTGNVQTGRDPSHQIWKEWPIVFGTEGWGNGGSLEKRYRQRGRIPKRTQELKTKNHLIPKPWTF